VVEADPAQRTANAKVPQLHSPVEVDVHPAAAFRTKAVGFLNVQGSVKAEYFAAGKGSLCRGIGIVESRKAGGNAQKIIPDFCKNQLSICFGVCIIHLRDLSLVSLRIPAKKCILIIDDGPFLCNCFWPGIWAEVSFHLLITHLLLCGAVSGW